MQMSIVLARILGPALLLIGIGLLLNRPAYRAMIEEAVASRGFVFLSGLLTLLAGLAIVNFHNVWALGWPVLITIFGWLMLISGVVRILAPDAMKRVGLALVKEPERITILAAILVIVGAVLTIAGYFR